jgi:hypothetical protein
LALVEAGAAELVEEMLRPAEGRDARVRLRKRASCLLEVRGVEELLFLTTAKVVLVLQRYLGMMTRVA